MQSKLIQFHKLAYILIAVLVSSCNLSEQSHQESEKMDQQNKNPERRMPCDYINSFTENGNTKIDTFRKKGRLIDPIDDTISFKKTKFGFVLKGSQLYKKAKTHRDCNGQHVIVEYYQDMRDRIDIDSYRSIDDHFFTTNNKVYFWWVNSDGHLIFPVNDADAKTFKPFENMCGGTDKRGVYYGCPNRGVYKLDIPITSKFEFFAKKDNYWNAPKHYVVIDNKVHHVRYELEKGYFCELDENISLKDIVN